MGKADYTKQIIALNFVPNANIKALNLLINRTNNIEDIFTGNIDKSQLSRPETNILRKIKKNKDMLLEQAEKELELIDRDESLKVVTILDKEYPEELKGIYDPPILLYIKGELKKEDIKSFAIVGTRTPTKHGMTTAYTFGNELSKFGITVISGMALGIDTYAHRGALDGAGRTIAVLGSGLYKIYPYENMDLYVDISQHGAVISEFPLQQKAEKYNFPRRNRIISGLSLGTIVIEAASRSGALITANFALQQGKEVFAVPGSIYNKVSQGTNKLIKDGAKLVQSVKDIIEEFNDELVFQLPPDNAVSDDNEQQREYDLTATDKKILSFLSGEAVTVNYIARKSGLKIEELESKLMMLEINGFVSQIPGQKFIKIEDQ